jgi:hypothetical protein
MRLNTFEMGGAQLILMRNPAVVGLSWQSSDFNT